MARVRVEIDQTNKSAKILLEAELKSDIHQLSELKSITTKAKKIKFEKMTPDGDYIFSIQ